MGESLKGSKGVKHQSMYSNCKTKKWKRGAWHTFQSDKDPGRLSGQEGEGKAEKTEFNNAPAQARRRPALPKIARKENGIGNQDTKTKKGFFTYQSTRGAGKEENKGKGLAGSVCY